RARRPGAPASALRRCRRRSLPRLPGSRSRAEPPTRLARVANQWQRDVTDYGALLRARCVCPRVGPLSRGPRRRRDSRTVKAQFLEGATLAFVRSGLVVVVALGALAAAAPAAGVAVVSGTVLLDPALPVCKVGQPCTKPLAHFKLVFWRHGRVAARV